MLRRSRLPTSVWSTSLATGDLRITGSTVFPVDALNLRASIQDVLYFSGAVAGDVATMRMTVNGTQSGNAQTWMSFEYHDYACYVDPSGDDSPIGVFFTPVVLKPGSQFIEHTFNIGYGPVFVSFSLSSGVGQGSAKSLDYDDPITIELPPGVTFTSQSEEFLNDRPAAPVPEPATLALLGVGLAGLGSARRKW